MIEHLPLGLKQALALTLEHTPVMDAESIALQDATDRVAAADLYALVDAPSIDASLKDGYAVISSEVAGACAEKPVQLRLAGILSAGDKQLRRLFPGETVRVLTGARIPQGADAVLSEEYARPEGDTIYAGRHAEPGRNIQLKGSDVVTGGRIVVRGQQLTPGRVGLLAAAGYSALSVFQNPRVAVVATGDEVVAPGMPLSDGKLYASNSAALGAWCRRYGMRPTIWIARDDAEEIRSLLQRAAAENDAVLTSGGAWTGDKDLVSRILGELGWYEIFHRIRIGPGKAVGFGLLGDKPVFILPGGPPSNLIAFLQIALPGLLKLAGHAEPMLPSLRMQSACELNGRYKEWTQFILGRMETRSDKLPLFHPLQHTSRLQSMAEATVVAIIPEGRTQIAAGEIVETQRLE
jgi:molybdopterin molybdotransferase